MNHAEQMGGRRLGNLDSVAAPTPYDGSRLQITLRSGTSVMAGRSRSKALRRMAV